MLVHPIITKSMVIATRQKHQISPLKLNLTIGTQSIEQVQQHRVLGVILDCEFKWQAQIQHICKKVAKNVFLLSKLKQYTDKRTLEMFHHAHVMPHINYVSTLWDGSSDVHLKKLDSLYRRSAKLIVKDNASTDMKLKMLNFLPLEKHLKLNKAIFMHKLYHGKVPFYITSLFNKATHRYGSVNLIPPIPRIDLYKTSLAFSGTSVWNSLPSSFKHLKSLKSFKKCVKNHLMSE
eukprot:GHVL01040461.1.p1 GENE.GHVL01040461.1~~GHVL01040461.1.p1  ORF type:complete len:234 (-),score=-6.72 GHVL01040461.1:355-1056(-)